MRMGLPVERSDSRHQPKRYSPVVCQHRGLSGTRYTTPSVRPWIFRFHPNFERYLCYLVGEDAGKVRALMEQMRREGMMSIPKGAAQAGWGAVSRRGGGEEETLEQIATTYREPGYILDPHSAVGVRAAGNFPVRSVLPPPIPAKFGESGAAGYRLREAATAFLREPMDRATLSDSGRG